MNVQISLQSLVKFQRKFIMTGGPFSVEKTQISPSVKLGLEGYKYSKMLNYKWHSLPFIKKKTFVQGMPSGPNDETKTPLTAFR